MLKNPLRIILAVVAMAGLQVWLSYLSYQSFTEGNLLLGFSFFLGVPGLAILIVLLFTAFRRRSPKGTTRKVGQKNP